MKLKFIKKQILFFNNDDDDDDTTDKLHLHFFTDIDEIIDKIEKYTNFKIDIKLSNRKYSRKLIYDEKDWYGFPSMNYDMRHSKHRVLTFLYYKREKHIVNDIKLMLGIQNQPIFSKSIYYPQRLDTDVSNKICVSDVNIQPTYPIYIISKGRYERRRTANYLDDLNIDYKIVVEENEKDLYIQHGQDETKILVMPNEWKSQQIQLGFGGGIPVRNFVHHHSKNILKTKRHWILDDNINGYYRLYNCKRIKCYSSAVFRVIEDYTDTYENVYISGHNYAFFVVDPFIQPTYLNTKIYSSILIHNDLNDIFGEKYLWRGTYNEDVDLIIRTLKMKLPTICFNMFSSMKNRTMTDKGGNTDTIYSIENAHFKKSNELHLKHPDCVSIVQRYGRTHHYVDYSSFKNNPFIKKIQNNNTQFNEYDLKFIEG
jgi:hypothetical protein